MAINEMEIKEAIATLHGGKLFEIRMIDGRWNASGYFTDADTLLKELRRFSHKQNANIYTTLNYIKPECYDRKQRNKLIENATPTTSDNDIEGMAWLMIDLDPKRSAGTGSTNEQIKKATEVAREIYKYLKMRSWQDPVVAMSGNGVHLLYKVELANQKATVELLKNTLLTLNMLFADNEIDVDLKTFNPARICKLYGTEARKGSNTENRPYRMSKIMSIPSEIKANDVRLLKELVELLPKEEKPQKYNNYSPREFDIEKWINEHGIRISSIEDWNGGKKYILEECLFDSSHRGKDASIIQTADGKLCYNCFHNSCAGKQWKDVRLMFEPNAYARKDRVPHPNYLNKNYIAERETQDVEGKPRFYTMEDIMQLKTPPEEFLKTGIKQLDRKLRGLKKGFVTVMSGLRGCGKSSIISQISLHVVEQGYKVALYSGELTATNAAKWINLQAAGRNNVVPTQYETEWTVPIEIRKKIAKWLGDKIFIYNNEYGNDYTRVEEILMECVKKHKIDLIILDNLMSLNIDGLAGYDKYAKQSQFVEHLENFAKKFNIHIIFVAHPRKSNGFLRLDDVSGSNDIVNRVDNAIIMHRVNEDFKRLSKDMFKWSDDKPIYKATNVIEICKDRESGVIDEFIPLYFERESKWLRNEPYENVVYGWEQADILADIESGLPL